MILTIFKYFARFVSLEGILSLFASGRSENEAYEKLMHEIKNATTGIIPGLKYYVFGQSFDSVKQRVDQLDGCYLFVEIGDLFSDKSEKGAIQDTLKLAATIAKKVSTTSDLVEQAIASDETLSMINILRAHLMKNDNRCSWMKYLPGKHSITPFVSTEFSSVGWTLLFDPQGSDMMDVRDLSVSFSRE